MASAVCRKLGADLLIVDEKLLGAVTKTALGRLAEEGGPRSSGSKSVAGVVAPLQETKSSRASGVIPIVLSFFLSGGRLSFAWGALCQAW